MNPLRDNPSSGQKAEVTTNFKLYPALTVMVFLRRDLGYRLVNPNWLLLVTIVEIVIAMVFHPMNGGPNALFLFAIAAFVTGVAQRIRRWREVNRGVKQHSFYIGTSPFEFPWMPSFLQRKRRIARTIDPFICVVAGLMVWRFFPALGFWLCFSGACLYSIERGVRRMEQNQALDMVDGIIVSEVQGDTLEEFEEAPSAREQRPAPGIPAGLGDDLHARIKRREPAQSPSLKGK